MVDLEGATVNANDQLNTAIRELQGSKLDNETGSAKCQGTLLVPHGSVPVTEYNNPSLWLGAYPWLFPYGKGGPEVVRKVKVGLRAYMKYCLVKVKALGWALLSHFME